MNATREQRIEQALFRGGSLTLDNPAYCHAVRAITESLVHTDLAPEDLTARALATKDRFASGAILAREGGVVAGLEEFAFLMRAHGVEVAFERRDGDGIKPGDTLL